jgi:hypothetical protein
VGANAYELDLPSSLGIHPVLNVSRLKPYFDGFVSHPDRPQPHHRPPPEIVQEDGGEVYDVKQILAKRGRGSRLQYLVEWVGYPSWDATWEPVSALGNARDALAEFESRS